MDLREKKHPGIVLVKNHPHGPKQLPIKIYILDIYEKGRKNTAQGKSLSHSKNGGIMITAQMFWGSVFTKDERKLWSSGITTVTEKGQLSQLGGPVHTSFPLD